MIGIGASAALFILAAPPLGMEVESKVEASAENPAMDRALDLPGQSDTREAPGANIVPDSIVVPNGASMTSFAADQGEIIEAPAPPVSIMLPRDTPIHLMVVSEVTTKTHSAGHRFKLRVNEPVVIGLVEVIPVGAMAWGQVTSAKSSGNLGKSGRLNAELLYVEIGDEQIAIDGQTSDKGNSGTAETVMGVLGLGIFGLFANGNDAKIKAGEKMTAFTVEDVEIDLQAGE